MSDRRQDEMIDALLRQAHDLVGPADSWQALRSRIDDRLRPAAAAREVIFWRRIALAAAACLLLTATILSYLVLKNAGAGRSQSALASATPPLLNDAQIERLTQAFSQVRSIFDGHSPWLMIDSFGNSQLGLTEAGPGTMGMQSLIIVRLMLGAQQSDVEQPYADLVAFPQQRIDVQVRTAAGSTIAISLVPTPQEDGRISLDLVAQGDGGERTDAIVSVGGSVVQSIARVRAGAGWVHLGAMARLVHTSERG
jgi:hypothetical protein